MGTAKDLNDIACEGGTLPNLVELARALAAKQSGSAKATPGQTAQSNPRPQPPATQTTHSSGRSQSNHFGGHGANDNCAAVAATAHDDPVADGCDGWAECDESRAALPLAAPRIPATDQGNAERFAELHGRTVRHVEDRDEWRSWTGSHWAADTARLHRQLAVTTARSIQEEAELLSNEPIIGANGKPRASPRERLQAWAYASESERELNAMLNLARHTAPVTAVAADFDRDPWALCTPCGLVNLVDGKIAQPAPQQHQAKCTRGKYSAERTSFDLAPTWHAFLAKTFAGDQELIDWMGRAVGMSLIALQEEHIVFFCYGGGRNGKSTLLNALMYALGNYTASIPEDLLIDKGNPDHPTGLTLLEGARLAIGSEVPRGKAWNEVLIKKLSGGDPITARKMRNDFYAFPPTHKLWLAGNDKPRVRDSSEGMWRRLRLIPFTNTLATGEVDKKLGKKLEAEADGIVQWAVEGCLQYQRLGLGDCRAVDDATRTYRAEEDHLGRFLAECCRFEAGLQVTKSAFRAAVSRWCEDDGCKPPGDKEIARALRARGCGEIQLHGGARAWTNVGLLPPS